MSYGWFPVRRDSRLGKTRTDAPPGYEGRQPLGTVTRATTYRNSETPEEQNYQTKPIPNNYHRFSRLQGSSEV